MISQHDRGGGHKNLPLCMVLYKGPFWNFFRLNSNISSETVKTPDSKKKKSLRHSDQLQHYWGYLSFLHPRQYWTNWWSVFTRIHPQCNVHHNQRNHDVVVNILLAHWFISLLVVFCMSLINSWSLPLGYKGMNGVMNSCRFRLLY